MLRIAASAPRAPCSERCPDRCSDCAISKHRSAAATCENTHTCISTSVRFPLTRISFYIPTPGNINFHKTASSFPVLTRCLPFAVRINDNAKSIIGFELRSSSSLAVVFPNLLSSPVMSRFIQRVFRFRWFGRLQ